LTNELIILGVLHNKPMTGYDIKKICEEQFMHYSDVNTSSIYLSLKNLEKEGFLISKSIQEGHMIKNVYSITSKGRKELKNHLIEKLSKSSFPKDNFNVGLSFSNTIQKKEFLEILKKRKEAFLKSLDIMKKVKNKYLKQKKVGENYEILFERGIMHMNTEIDWILWAEKKLR